MKGAPSPQYGAALSDRITQRARENPHARSKYFERRRESVYEFESSRLAVPGSRPALSPLMMVQEMAPSRWAAVVGALLCVRTARPVSHQVCWALLAEFPEPSSVTDESSWPALAAILEPAGLVGSRMRTIVTVSTGWLHSPEEGLSAKGVGEYVSDSDRVFGQGDLSSVPHDRVLHDFVRWARARERQGEPWRPSYR